MVRKFIKQIQKKSAADPGTIVLPESNDERILRAAELIAKKGIARLIILGKQEEVLARAKELKLKLKTGENLKMIDYNSFEKRKQYIDELYKLRKHKGMTPEQAEELLKKPTYFGTMLVHMGEADGMVSGATHSTADTVRPALQIIKTHEKFHKVSSFFFMLLKEKLLLFADCAIIIEPDAETLAEIALDTAANAETFGIKPRVAMLSFSTKGSAKHASVDKVRKAVEMAKQKKPGLIIDGEMQVDAALVPEVCKKKCSGCALHGNANVMIFPDLQSGNIAYKLVERLAKANAVGPILQGLRKPVNDLSRGCSVQDIVDVVAITSVEARKSKEEK